MGALHEIVELGENCDSELSVVRNGGKRHLEMEKTLKKHTVEDDINRLFEAIDIGSSRRGFGQPERRFKETLHKMKRPMRVGPSQDLGIGISEAASLKQALRGLCISQASEMAAVKKRTSRPSASPAFLETGAFKKLYRSAVIESEEVGQISLEGKQNVAEISLVTERSSSTIASEVSQSGHSRVESLVLSADASKQSAAKLKTAVDISCAGPHAELGQSSNSDKEFSKLNEIVACSTTVIEQNQENSEIIKSTDQTSGLSKQSSRIQNRDSSSMVCRTPDSALEKGPEELDKPSPTSSSNVNVVTNITALDTNKHDLVPRLSSKTKNTVIKADERSRSREKGEISQSSKSSIGEYSSTTSYSEESYLSGSSRSGHRPHMSKDLRWVAISSVQKQHGNLGLKHFKLLRKIGSGDIATVYLSELIGTNCLFAVKIMDNESLISRKKMMRAQTEKEILEILDHPFLPTLYTHFTSNKFSCLVMEYCPGGDLHVLRQKQLSKCFPEKAARFYVAEVLLALEYLHMLGVVYRDLKPENILVREDGHIMVSDFDLSLRCSVNPFLLKSSSPVVEPQKKASSSCSDSSCIDPFCLQPSWQMSCFTTRFLSASSRTRKLAAPVISLPQLQLQLVVEPTNARSNSFVGTHEYLAPEIIKGEGHGSAVDWWTFGIFLYELLYGRTPFKGSSNEDTISNVVSQCLNFPHCPIVSSHARDLIRRLLTKEPEIRLGSSKGAAEIKQHPFFQGLNWALIRCETPPELPKFWDLGNILPDTTTQSKTSKFPELPEHEGDGIEFEMF